MKLLGLLALFVMMFILWQVTRQQSLDGFIDIQAPFPQIKQASFIPSDSATATTARPGLAKPEMRDYVEAHDSFEYLLAAYNPQAVAAGAAGVSMSQLAPVLKQAIAGIPAIRAYIANPESVPSRDILDQAQAARRIADKLRRTGVMAPWNGMFVSEPGPNDANYYCSDNLRAL